MASMNNAINCQKKAVERIGEVRFNSKGVEMKITKYLSSTNVEVEFENGYVTHTSYANFLHGTVKSCNNFLPVAHNDKSGAIKNVTYHKGYSVWLNMLVRCSPIWQRNNMAYVGCKCVDEWLIFENFAKWFDKNIYDIGETLQLDKDILIHGNRLYGPDTCIFVPQSINLIFTRRNVKRGAYPIGVLLNKSTGKFQAHCGVGECSPKKIGLYSTPVEAFNAYKVFRENRIKEIAENYKSRIPRKVYNAMLAYRVNIDD